MGKKGKVLAASGQRQHCHVDHSDIRNVVNDVKLWNEDSHIEDGAVQQNVQGRVSHIKGVWLWSGHPYADAFIRCNRQYGSEAAGAFLNLVIHESVDNLKDRNRFFGVLACYEFLNQESDILKRRKTEKASLGRLRGQLEKTTSTLINEVEDFKKGFNSWEEETQQKCLNCWSNHWKIIQTSCQDKSVNSLHLWQLRKAR